MFHLLQNVLIILLSYFYLFIIHEYTKEKTNLQISLNKKKKKKNTKEFGEAKEKAYIGRNIKINKKNMAETVNVDMLDFFNYLDCRDSGVTNMFDITTVKSITGLSKEQIIYIIKNFSELEKKYL